MFSYNQVAQDYRRNEENPSFYQESKQIDNDDFVSSKASELFKVCDKEEKGYITKTDMQLLHNEVSLDDEQLGAVFDRLDQNKSGILTFQEFLNGFGGFLEMSSSVELEHFDINEPNHYPKASDVIPSPSFSINAINDISSSDVEDHEQHSIEAVIHELNETRKEKEAAERVLKERSETYESQLRELSEEMEEQIQHERQKTIKNEVMRERHRSTRLKTQLQEKENHLFDVVARQKALEEELTKVNSGKIQVKEENSQLMQLNETLSMELRNTRKELENTLLQMEVLQKQMAEQLDANQAEVEATKFNLEKKSLIGQLEALREHNRKLRDDKDAILFAKNAEKFAIVRTSTPTEKRPLLKQGSDIGKYLKDETTNQEQVNKCLTEVVLDGKTVDPFCDVLENVATDSPEIRKYKENQNASNSSSKERNFEKELHLLESDDTDPSNEPRVRNFYRKLSQVPDGCSSPENSFHDNTELPGKRQSWNELPLKGEIHSSEVLRVQTQSPPAPDRIYKVVFIGNSGVGKTSIIRQFASKTFRSDLSATVGVDYQVKALTVDGQQIALQLWDTAGQERYRSITRQYFRKADGVVVVYDVTNEQSFLAVRNWMQDVQEGCDSSVVILLLGNKCDCVENETNKMVATQDGFKLAEEYGAAFFETSAKSGRNILASMTSLSVNLTRLEDEQKENVLSLATNDETVAKSCCFKKRN